MKIPGPGVPGSPDMIQRFSPRDRLAVSVLPLADTRLRQRELTTFAFRRRPAPLSRHPGWLRIFNRAFGHTVYAIEATACGQTCGFLPLAFVESFLFGRFLVSLPYLNTNGVEADSPDVAAALVDRAVMLADELGARHLELRHEAPVEHPALDATLTNKVHMRLALPDTPEQLWKGFDSKVRNQIRKGEKQAFRYQWGGAELIEPFYKVLAENMRDLGTPVYGRNLFDAVLDEFPNDAEICVAFDGSKPIAAGLLLHGHGTTEVPTASSLRAHNSSCVNMVVYRQLLERSIERGQAVFDFGRSTTDGATFRFKKQWGAIAEPATWQYATWGAGVGEMRPDHPKYRRLIQVWQRLPVGLTRLVGPRIVRGIP